MYTNLTTLIVYPYHQVLIGLPLGRFRPLGHNLTSWHGDERPEATLARTRPLHIMMHTFYIKLGDEKGRTFLFWDQDW